MRELTKREVHAWLDRVDSESKVYTVCIHRSRFGKYHAWCEKVVKVDEMDEPASTAFKLLMELTKAQKLEAICNEKTGEPDRVKIVVEP